MAEEQTMHCKVASILTTLLALISSNAVAQPPKHPEAEKAQALIVLKKDNFDYLKIHTREVMTK